MENRRSIKPSAAEKAKAKAKANKEKRIIMRKFTVLLLVLAVVFTGIPSYNAFAAVDEPSRDGGTQFDASVVSAVWLNESDAEITFDQPVSLGDDIKSKVQYQGLSFIEKYLGTNDSISASGNTVCVSVPGRVSGGDTLFFHPGALRLESGSENTELITVKGKMDKRITSAVYSPACLTSSGGSVSVQLRGKNLYTAGEWLTVKVYLGSELKKTITPDEGATSFSFTLPENSGTENQVYRLEYLSSRYDYNASPITLDEGVSDTVIVEGRSSAADPEITEINYSATVLKAGGGEINVELKGSALSQLDAEDFVLKCEGSIISSDEIPVTYACESDTRAVAAFVLPPNESSSEDVSYEFSVTRGAGGISNTQIITVKAFSETSDIETITYDMNSSDLHGGATLYYVGGPLHATFIGDNLDKLTREDFVVTLDGEPADGVSFSVDEVDGKSAAVTFSFPANDLEQAIEYSITALRAADGVSNKVFTIGMDPKPQDKEDKFFIATNMWTASEISEGVVRVHVEEPAGIRLRVSPDDYKHNEDFIRDIHDYIFFENMVNESSGRRYLTSEDTVSVDDGDIIISLADNRNAIPNYVVFATGALVNNEGKILGNDEFGKNHNRYILRGAHIDSISFNKVTFTHEGGEVKASVKGSMLNDNEDTLTAKIFVENQKNAADDIAVETTVAEDGKTAEIRFVLPRNTTDRTISYRVTPVINGTNAVAQYIKGYDVISVLPAGASETDITLSSVEILGSYDMDDRLDVFRTSTSAEQFTTKIDAVIRGTNLSSKKTLVRAIDENGVVWPMLPVFECGATIRWQSSAYYLPEKESKNEQHIELLLPRRLGVDHTFTLQFAPDGKHFLESPTATVIVENDGLFDSSFIEEDFTILKDIEVRYVDESGKELAPSEHYKGYGITELYHMGIAPKNIKGYTLKSKYPINLDKMLAQPVQHESGEFIFTEGQWFVTNLMDEPIVYTYTKASPSAAASATASSQPVSDGSAIQKIKAAKVKKLKVKAKKGGKAIITFKKLGKGYKYEIRRSLKKKKGFKKAAVTTKGKKTIKKLKRGKRYYFKVRAYKVVNGKKVYTKYSKTVKIKAK